MPLSTPRENRKPRAFVFQFFLAAFALFAIALFSSCHPKPPDDASLSRYIGARQAYEKGNLAKARIEFKACADENSDFYQARFMEAKVAYYMGDVQDSMAIFSRLTDGHPGFFDAWVWKALCLKELKRATEAEEIFNRLLSYRSEDFGLLYEMGKLRLMQNNLADSLDYLKKAALHDVDLARIHLSLAKIYFDQGMLAQSKKELALCTVLLENHGDSILLDAARKLGKVLSEGKKL